MPSVPVTLGDVSLYRPGRGVAHVWLGVTAANLAAAKAAAASGDTVIVGPGSWTASASLAKNGVNWHFLAGASVGITDAYLFDCGTSALSFQVTGEGNLSATQTSGTAGILTTFNASANVLLRARNLSLSVAGLDTSSACVACLNGRVSVYADLIQTSGDDYCVWWRNGNCYVSARRIMSSSSVFAAVSGVYFSAVTGKLWVTADEIVQTSTGIGAVVAGDANATADVAHWITAKEIRSAATNGTGAVESRGGKLYVNAQKIFAPSGVPIRQWTAADSTLYVDCQKVEAGKAADLATGRSWQTVQQWLDNGATPSTLVAVSGGTHDVTVKNLERTGAGDGLTVSGGTLNLSASRVSVASGNDLVRSGGTFNVTGGSGSGTGGVYATSGTITYPGGYTGTMTVGGQTATVQGGRVVSVA